VDSEIGKNATIEANISSLEPVDQLAIGQAISTRLCVNTSNPKSAKLTLALPTIAISVLTRFRNRLLGNAKYA